jgi:hypothetical protein
VQVVAAEQAAVNIINYMDIVIAGAELGEVQEAAQVQ